MGGRRTVCPDGRQAYAWSDPELAGGFLDTRTGLGKLRLQLAEGQEPVGSAWTGRQWAALYRVADAVAMPALSPARQARYDAVRTCHRCHKTNLVPWSVEWTTGRRACQPCSIVLRDTEQARQALVARAAVVAHAQALLADPALAVAVEVRPPQEVSAYWRHLVAIDGSGTVLAAWQIASKWAARDAPGGLAGLPAGCVQMADSADEIRALSQRRIVAGAHDLWWIAAWQQETGHPEPHLCAQQLVGPHRAPTELGANVDVLAGRWLGIDNWLRLQSSNVAGPSDDELMAVGGPLAIAQSRLLLLRRIAADRHPTGRPRCPVWPVNNQCQCSGTPAGNGLCASHEGHMPAAGHLAVSDGE